MNQEELQFLHQQLLAGHTLYIRNVGWAPSYAEWTPPNQWGTNRMREMESHIRHLQFDEFEIRSSFTEDVERRRLPQDYIARTVSSWRKTQELLQQKVFSKSDVLIVKKHE
ncbi:MAG: hypothetical protein VX278_19700 [Myxococcota bacterium]|nr:hypothetical protein [Myxococcota bacterium]